eukprot:TRINITY_DN12146_c0_g2_i8.p1 TRINITY_DN12146_c0_g2~~TRINITY_DN12146_c0_g2_i8.p1  ORF type:complete len:599 (+),score=134.50 TRINITY_DN12146_c0_g2_i8:428-2224(+)
MSKSKGGVGKELAVGEFHAADESAPFKHCRNIVGPIEFAVFFRFMELLIEERVKGNEKVMSEFSDSMISTLSTSPAQSHIKAFKSVFQQLNTDFERKIVAESTEKVPDSLKSSWPYIKSLATCFKNPEVSSAFSEGKKDLSGFLDVEIQVVRLTDYKVVEKFDPVSHLFKSKPVIFVGSIKEGEHKLFYEKKESPGSKKPGKSFIILPCLHRWDLMEHTTAALTLKFDHPQASLVLKCPEPLCFEILDAELAKKVLGAQCERYFRVSEKADKTACMIDGTATETNVKMDEEHYMCIKCMNLYLSTRKHLDALKRPLPVNCPVKSCNAIVEFKQYFRALDKKELLAVREALNQATDNEEAKEKRPAQFCPYCSKDASKSVVEHVCSSYPHESCLKKYAEEKSATCGLHEILCKSCGSPFPPKVIENLFAPSDSTLIMLRKNMEEKAATLQCKVCHAVPKGVCTEKWIKCSCGCKFCRLCGNISDSHKCYPRREQINQLATINKGVKDVLPCPRCRQLNLLFVQELVSVCANCRCTFCGECGGDQEVINSHGSEYHRPSCSKRKLTVKGQLSCELCKKGKKCRKPKDLEEGELPEEEFFS